MEAIAIRNKAW